MVRTITCIVIQDGQHGWFGGWYIWYVCTIHTVVVYVSGGKDRGRYLGTTAKSSKFID